MKNLPSGTVTFLFTDIEGSTKLLHELGENYAELLADHREIIRKSFLNWDGQEVDTQGDAFFLAFPRAGDGVAAAAEIQRALVSHKWPDGVVLRVRMGLHTGEPVVAQEGYIGMDVHRAARIAHIGHGGQVLLSESVVALCRDQLPDGLTLRDLGEHQLKDLSRPEPVYQLAIQGLQEEFPALNSLDVRPNNLPVQQTSFVGRRAEIESVKALVEKERLVTIMGPGGIGKTRLSLQVAAELVEQFPHGVWFIELAPVPDPGKIPSVIADALHFNIDVHSSELEPKRQLIDYLGTRAALLVLDNFEHLLGGADDVADILDEAAQVKVLITTRERLNLRQEWVYSIDGLSLDDAEPSEGEAGNSALDLFRDRARQEQSSFSLEGGEKNAAARICRMLDGMPLGIELAAAWTSMLSCQEIAEEIEKNLDFLSTSMRGVAKKHRSLRAAFDYSWGLLTPEERSGFSKLGIFRGSFSHQAAGEVARVGLPMLTGFLHKSLLRRNSQGRFEIHEALRQYAEEALAANAEDMDLVREKHSRFYYQRLGELTEAIKGEEPEPSQVELRSIQGNIHAATYWILDHWEPEEARVLLSRLQSQFFTVGSHDGLKFFQEIAGHLRSGNGKLEAGTPHALLLLSALTYQTSFMSGLGTPGTEEMCLEILPPIRKSNYQLELGICLRSLGICAVYRGAYQEAIGYFVESHALIKDRDDSFGIISCLLWLGWAHSELGEFDQAYMYYSEAYEIAMDHREGAGLAYTLSKLGTLADIRGAHDEALKYHKQALDTFEEIGDQAGQGYALSRMSLSAWGLGEYKEAQRYGQDGYDRFFDIGHRWGIATSLCRIGFAEVGLGKLVRARELFFEGMERSLSYNYSFITVYAFIGLAFILAREGRKGDAIELLAAALTNAVTPAQYRIIAQNELNSIKSDVTADEFEASWELGEDKSLENVIDSLKL